MMNIIFDLWIISGIFAVACIFISPYFFYNILAPRYGMPPISLEENFILIWQELGNKIFVLILSCLLLGPIALVKINIDAYTSVKDTFDDLKDN